MLRPAQLFRQFKRRRRLAAAHAELASRPADGRAHGLASGLVVSLTSYPARFGVLPLTLECLLRQSLRPDLTVLWVAHADMEALPAAVRALAGPAFEIRATDDLRSYTKILPALAAFPGAAIVTADDDVYCHADWLERLVAAHAATGDPVIAHRAHLVRMQPDGMPAAYADWEVNTAALGPSPRLFPTGCSGVFYAPGSFAAEVGDRALIARLCPRADDVWLYWMHRLAGHAARKIGGRVRILEWEEPGAETLRSFNLQQGGNDLQIRAMLEHFGWPGSA
jgi:hypothetical protein